MLHKRSSVYFLGIKGAGMANLAVLLKQMGNNVYGADVEERFPTDVLLEEAQIIVNDLAIARLPEHIDTFIYSASHGGSNNSLYIEAQKRGIWCMHQAELLGELSKHYHQSTAICGVHGKTTTSALLSHALVKLNQDPSFFIGAPSFGNLAGNRVGKSDYFIIEADEYGMNPPGDKRAKFLSLFPKHAIATNIDFDHPDVFDSIDHVKSTFLNFFRQIVEKDSTAMIFANYDDQALRAVAEELPQKHVIWYGKNNQNGYVIDSVTFDSNVTSFNLAPIGRFDMSLFGEHNVYNTAGVIAFLHKQGFSYGNIQSAIRDFTGAKRRFELIFEYNGIYLFDDYAHHPKELEALYNAAKARFPTNRIVFIFQPHTFSRTTALMDEFSKIFTVIDHVILLPIFASAREKQEDYSVTLDKFQSDNSNGMVVADTKNLIPTLRNNIQKHDVIFTVGAGNVYQFHDDIIHVIKEYIRDNPK